jgi:hypothetical protein
VDEIAYLERRCCDHQRLARKADVLAVARLHQAFVLSYQRRIADLVEATDGTMGSQATRDAA